MALGEDVSEDGEGLLVFGQRLWEMVDFEQFVPLAFQALANGHLDEVVLPPQQLVPL